jgi:hypothetical protein
MSKRIDEVGEFPVTLGTPFWEELDAKDGDNLRMALVIPCATDNGCSEFYRLYFTRGLIARGQNVGRTLYAVSAEQCVKLGMPEPFDPTAIGELEGKQATLVMREDNYNGKVTIKPAFLNPVYREKLDPGKAADLWAQMIGEQAPDRPAAQAAALAKRAATVDLDDDLPW